MKKNIVIGFLAAAMIAFSGCCSCGCRDCGAQPNISVFAHYVKNVAQQRHVSLTEAAGMLYDLGIRGFDIGPGEPILPELAASKLRPINFYFFPNLYAADNGAADCRFCLDQAEKYGVPRVMVVPPNFTKDGDQEAEFRTTLSGMKLFVSEARKRGITITVEDFGGTKNPCSHVKYLKRFLDEIPDLKFALDSGNLYYASRGEDILELMAYAKGRIEHVHLKDQTKDDHHCYAELGLGGVPNEQVVKGVNATGYDGWYTLENTVKGADVYYEAVRQVAVLKAWLKESSEARR